ncbi:MogA/MoaB family molybdenum cofactor biosynthesis protein [Granulicoccus sp. GXG6511]|uniref:MogA/MoaB family molybdenum cofactor biosynthesis protein n=1 Tax=Granulicoccus sp. GXG6511 TaxID=3381351 RepID=UPI003D7D615E
MTESAAHSIRACVITASTRAAAGEYADRSGPLLADGLQGLGIEVAPVIVVADGDPVGAALRAAVGAYDIVLTTGGTGLSPTDSTPEQTRPLLDREIPQLAAEIARAGVAKGVATAVLSRGLAGVANRTLVINLPGSRGGVRDAMEVLAPVLVHAVEQIRGGDH